MTEEKPEFESQMCSDPPLKYILDEIKRHLGLPLINQAGANLSHPNSIISKVYYG